MRKSIPLHRFASFRCSLTCFLSLTTQIKHQHFIPCLRLCFLEGLSKTVKYLLIWQGRRFSLSAKHMRVGSIRALPLIWHWGPANIYTFQELRNVSYVRGNSFSRNAGFILSVIFTWHENSFKSLGVFQDPLVPITLARLDSFLQWQPLFIFMRARVLQRKTRLIFLWKFSVNTSLNQIFWTNFMMHHNLPSATIGKDHFYPEVTLKSNKTHSLLVYTSMNCDSFTTILEYSFVTLEKSLSLCNQSAPNNPRFWQPLICFQSL